MDEIDELLDQYNIPDLDELAEDMNEKGKETLSKIKQETSIED